MSEETKEEAPKNGASSITIKLRKPVIANGDEVNELVFREPTGADIEAVGNPVNLDLFSGDIPKIAFEAKVMTSMMSRLAAVPTSTIRLMHPKDWNTAAWSLANFFTPEL